MTAVPARTRSLADAYDQGAAAYGRVLAPTLTRMACDAVDIAGIAAGHRLLDLACGTGLIADIAHAAGARVTGVDVSPGMLVTARTRSADTVVYLVADAAILPFRGAAFDIVTCGLSLSHFVNVDGALREVARVLRPQGVFLASTWAPSKGDPSYAAAFAIYERHCAGVPRHARVLLDEVTWSDADRGRARLTRARFGSVRVIRKTMSGRYATSDAAVDWAFAWPLTAERLAYLEPGHREQVRTEALAAIESTDDLRWERAVHYYRAVVPP